MIDNLTRDDLKKYIKYLEARVSSLTETCRGLEEVLKGVKTTSSDWFDRSGGAFEDWEIEQSRRGGHGW